MFRLIKLVIWIFIILAIVFFVQYNNFKNKGLTEDKTINIITGDNIVLALNRELNTDILFLKIYLKLNPLPNDFNLQVGNYYLISGDNINSIITKLSKIPLQEQQKLTILEGRNIYDIDEYLTNKELLKESEFIKESKNIGKYKLKYIFLNESLSLEGFLYPDTYFIDKGTFNLENFINTMLKNFNDKVYTKLLINQSSKEIIETIKFASIVEKEERNISEKSTVAGILIKRYKEKWMIGADITACYEYELTSEGCKLNLSKYIFEKNDYNTRTMVGLPKTPINNPSFDSVNAVINPKKSPYYYYLHDITTGKVYYAVTNEAHIQNKKLYIK